MKKALLILPIFAATVFLSGCSLYGNQTSIPNAPISTNNTSNTINIENFAFSPATLTVKAGTTITWTNNDGAPHQIKSLTFNSDSLKKGQSFSFTFAKVGTFDYSCGIHPSMLGKIIVE
jgi:plastocyanin